MDFWVCWNAPCSALALDISSNLGEMRGDRVRASSQTVGQVDAFGLDDLDHRERTRAGAHDGAGRRVLARADIRPRA